MTVNSPHIDEALVRFRAAVREIYGDRLERAVLFGSRARGDSKPDSDYDIAVFIEDAGTFSEESAAMIDSTGRSHAAVWTPMNTEDIMDLWLKDTGERSDA